MTVSLSAWFSKSPLHQCHVRSVVRICNIVKRKILHLQNSFHAGKSREIGSLTSGAAATRRGHPLPERFHFPPQFFQFPPKVCFSLLRWSLRFGRGRS